MSSRHAWLWAAALWSALGACANSRIAEGSSETHFLLLCSDDSCGDGLSCVCGVCSKPCTSDAMCSALSGDARCLSVGHAECTESRRCDVQCKADADCAALSDAHRCDNGRCRAPEPLIGEPPSPPMDSGPPASDAAAPPGDPCGLDPMIARIANGSSLRECGKLGIDATSAERADAVACMRNAWEAKGPFRLVWSLQGTDSVLEQGYSGVREGDELIVYALRYDSAGTEPAAQISSWTPCALLRIPESCADPEQCVQCEQRLAMSCGCREIVAGEADIGCRSETIATGSEFVPPCVATSCEFYGVCYPSTTGTEDGCCFCDNGMGSCIEPGWCPGWVSLGKRCASDSDCSPTSQASGLFCRTDFFGERGVCTRDCNFGCPTGYECVADVPGYDGGTVHNVCMLACSSAADCMVSTNGSTLGSECDMPPGLTRSYCF